MHWNSVVQFGVGKSIALWNPMETLHAGCFDVVATRALSVHLRIHWSCLFSCFEDLRNQNALGPKRQEKGDPSGQEEVERQVEEKPNVDKVAIQRFCISLASSFELRGTSYGRSTVPAVHDRCWWYLAKTRSGVGRSFAGNCFNYRFSIGLSG